MKFVLELIPRYARANFDLFRLISRARRDKKPVVFLVGDSDALITYNFLLVALGVPVVFRCGAAPPTHNLLRRLLIGIMKMTTTQYVVDSDYMQNVLTGHDIAADRIEVLRPMPPLRGPA
ncbi:MAG: hypothetical protein QM773_01290 [Hyphomonadaceae bacterium]